ncbi:MAG: hypothetical protein IJB82_02360 [Bacilli bacterium]|nr:hypothetical protein [Bacilli bacterium]
MKKYLVSIITVISCFFFCPNLNAVSFDVLISDGSVQAPLPTPYDTKIFNYFEEKSNNTDFYQLLDTYGDNILQYLGHNDNTIDYLVRLYNVEELISWCEYKEITDSICASIPTEANYIILVEEFYQNRYPNIIIEDNSLVFTQNSIDSNIWHSLNFYFFKDATLLNSYTSSYKPALGTGSVSSDYHILNSMIRDYKFSYNWIKTGWWIFGSKKYVGTDFSYFLSKIYYSTKNISYDSDLSDKPTINIETYLFDNKEYDSDTLKLEYLKNNSLISSNKSLLSLYSILNYRIVLNVPDNYEQQYFSNTEEVSLFPISTCTLKDYNLYLYSNSNKTISLYLHSINDKDELSYQASYYSVYKTFANNVLKANPLLRVNSAIIMNEDSTTNELETITFSDDEFTSFFYRLQAFDNKSDYIVYYNPECYVKSYNYEEITWVNPITNNTLYYNNEFSNWSDPENINKSNSILTEFSIADLIGSAWNGAKTFILAAYKIVELSTVLYALLPVEVSSLLLCILTIGSIILLYKLLK